MLLFAVAITKIQTDEKCQMMTSSVMTLMTSLRNSKSFVCEAKFGTQCFWYTVLSIVPIMKQMCNPNVSFAHSFEIRAASTISKCICTNLLRSIRETFDPHNVKTTFLINMLQILTLACATA